MFLHRKYLLTYLHNYFNLKYLFQQVFRSENLLASNLRGEIFATRYLFSQQKILTIRSLHRKYQPEGNTVCRIGR